MVDNMLIVLLGALFDRLLLTLAPLFVVLYHRLKLKTRLRAALRCNLQLFHGRSDLQSLSPLCEASMGLIDPMALALSHLSWDLFDLS